MFIQAALVTNTEPLDRTALKDGVLEDIDAYRDWPDQGPPVESAAHWSPDLVE